MMSMWNVELFHINTLQDTQLKTIHTKQAVLTTYTTFHFLQTFYEI
jgi:hypothetical protein